MGTGQSADGSRVCTAATEVLQTSDFFLRAKFKDIVNDLLVEVASALKNEGFDTLPLNQPYSVLTVVTLTT